MLLAFVSAPALVHAASATTALAIAQEQPTAAPSTVSLFGITVTSDNMNAILAILSGGIVAFLTQVIKKKIFKDKIKGVVSVLFTIVMTGAVTAVYFLFIHPMSPWSWATFGLYVAAVFGESTGYYHLGKLVTT
jgi:hypothetical protein